MIRPDFCLQEAYINYFCWNKTKLQSKIQTQDFSYVRFQVMRFTGNQISKRSMPEGENTPLDGSQREQ